MPDERRHSLQDACSLLNINNRQLHRFLEDLGIVPSESVRDARRKEITAADLVQLRELLHDEMADGRRHELERRVALLERRVVVLERLLQGGEGVPAPPVVPVSSVPSVAAQRSHNALGGSSDLPDGWVSLNDACRRYGVNVNTAKTHVGQRTLACHRGLWRSGMTRVEYALDPDEQVAFRTHFGVEAR